MKRILLKLSGEALAGEKHTGFDEPTVTDVAKQVKQIVDSGVQVGIVAEDSAIKTLDDVSGKRIGVQTSTTGDIYATGDYGEDAITRYDNGAVAVQALLADKVDCVIIDNEPAKSYVAANAGLEILETEYAVEDYAIAIAKDNTELLDEVNAALEKLTADGTIDKIIADYIKAE